MKAKKRTVKARAIGNGRPQYGAMDGAMLEQLMAQRGLSCHALERLLADEYGVKVKPRRLINGRRPSLDTLTALCMALECKLSALWDVYEGAAAAQKARAE